MTRRNDSTREPQLGCKMRIRANNGHGLLTKNAFRLSECDIRRRTCPDDAILMDPSGVVVGSQGFIEACKAVHLVLTSGDHRYSRRSGSDRLPRGVRHSGLP